MYKYFISVIMLLLLCSCSTKNDTMLKEHKTRAEQFILGIYGCDPSVVDELAADSVFISYPVFEKLFNKPALRGSNAVRKFAEGFCSRWKDARVTFHDAIAEGNNVVLVWSFSARNVSSANPDLKPDSLEHSWGGISLLRFNEAGKIVAEIGEETSPGPFERSNAGGDD